ncbi:MAG: hypothetical protein LiPW31_271 [Microgenomates group bacterium LiPW_31]|nr:MAG: hypothetical protein LiPW31_271 [Microgenomates group bacterium LiPW_31]
MLKEHQFLGVGMTPSKTELGRLLRTRRFGLGLTQAQVAKLSGIRQNYYSGLETGKRIYLMAKTLEGLAKAFRCDPAEFENFIPQRAEPKTEPRTELARLIHSRREQLGLTLQDFAERMGVSHYYAKYFLEGKCRSIGYGTLKSLAKVLQLETASLSKFLAAIRKQTNSRLGQLVRSRRRELGLSTIELAKELRVSRQLVTQIELGQCPLNRNDVMIGRLAKVLKLDVTELQAVRPKRRLKRKMAELTTLGGFVVARRQELVLTQSELARRAQIAPSMVCVIERGTYNPGRMTLEKISKALECQIPPELIPQVTKKGVPTSSVLVQIQSLFAALTRKATRWLRG